jgi:YXWGXW repeat-containing protein
MSKGRLLLGTLLLAGGLALPALSQAGVAVDIDVGPPAPQVEVVPPPRPGYVWAPGYWNWEGGRHVWVGGHWMGERRGYHWAPDHWESRGPHYHYEPGHWER